MPDPSPLRNEAITWLSSIVGDSDQDFADRVWASHLIGETLRGEGDDEEEPMGFSLPPCVGEVADDPDLESRIRQ